MLQVKALRATIQDDAALSVRTASRTCRSLPNDSVHAVEAAVEMSAESGYGTVLSSHRTGVEHLIGMDDHLSRFLGLSTVSQPLADQGASASNLLIDRLHRSGLPNPPTSHALGTTVIVRRSSRHRRRPALSPAA